MGWNLKGLDMNKLQEASQDSKQMQSDLLRLSKGLKQQYEDIIIRMNWIMKTQQEICNNLKITLKDPLEKK